MSYRHKSLIKPYPLGAACAVAGYALEVDAAGRFRRLRRLPSADHASAAGRAALAAALEALALASMAAEHRAFAACAWCGGREAEMWVRATGYFQCLCRQCGAAASTARSAAAAIESAWDRIEGAEERRARGPARGRPCVRLDTTALLRLAAREADITVARDCGVSRATLYRWLARLRTVRITLPGESDRCVLGLHALPGPPCPHCGKTAHAANCVNEHSGTWRVLCMMCNAMGPAGFDVTGAYERWSRRPAVSQATFSST